MHSKSCAGSNGSTSRQSPCHSSAFPITTFSAIQNPFSSGVCAVQHAVQTDPPKAAGRLTATLSRPTTVSGCVGHSVAPTFSLGSHNFPRIPHGASHLRWRSSRHPLPALLMLALASAHGSPAFTTGC